MTVGVLVESLKIGGVPGGVLGEQQAAGAGISLKVVEAKMIEGLELLLMTQEQGICAGVGGGELSGVKPIKDEELLLLQIPL